MLQKHSALCAYQVLNNTEMQDFKWNKHVHRELSLTLITPVCEGFEIACLRISQPIQKVWMFQSVQGLGGTCFSQADRRLVNIPAVSSRKKAPK
jgi:hypothetical protein